MIKKVVLIIVTLVFFILFVIGVPIVINEAYKNGGYITKWNAADVLGYYGTILGSVVSFGLLAITIYFDRRKFIKEAKLDSKMRKWQTIEQCANDVLDVLHPFNLKAIIFNSVDTLSIKMYSNILLYEINAIKAMDRFRFETASENDCLLTGLAEKIQIVMDKCIILQREFERCFYETAKEQLGSQYIKNQGEDDSCLNIYRLSVIGNVKERVDKLLSDLQNIYVSDYCPLVSQKSTVFSKIYNQSSLETNE